MYEILNLLKTKRGETYLYIDLHTSSHQKYKVFVSFCQYHVLEILTMNESRTKDCTVYWRDTELKGETIST